MLRSSFRAVFAIVAGFMAIDRVARVPAAAKRFPWAPALIVRLPDIAQRLMQPLRAILARCGGYFGHSCHAGGRSRLLALKRKPEYG
jgi:hypothetical protein